ncbi:UNVERIFIED_CONTAM: hypothetical protein K2H54_069753 [Gekko kuhli]
MLSGKKSSCNSFLPRPLPLISHVLRSEKLDVTSLATSVTDRVVLVPLKRDETDSQRIILSAGVSRWIDGPSHVQRQSFPVYLVLLKDAGLDKSLCLSWGGLSRCEVCQPADVACNVGGLKDPLPPAQLCLGDQKHQNRFAGISLPF